MTDRLFWLTAGLCYFGAGLFALLGGLSFAFALTLPAAWTLVGAALFLVICGVRSQSALQSKADALEQRHSQAELLEAQLAQQRQAIDALADGLDVAVFICDNKATVLYANQLASSMFKFDNPVGRTVLAITLSYDLEQLVLKAAQSGEAAKAEVTFTYPDERVGLAKAWCADSEGNRAFLSIYEITDLRRLERVRQDFVANVSHELRTPLAVIRAMAETLLDEEPESETAQRYLPKITTEVDRLSTITQDLLILSTAESNLTRKHACDIADVFRSVTVQLEPKAKGKGLELHYNGPDGLLIEANTAQMTQVALNLIDNAINYTAQGSVSITVTEQDGKAITEIKDTGIGIASDHLGRIFERFYRVDKGRSRNTGGTGLGLSIVRHIIEVHGGTVTVESALNRGSTFRVVLPIGEPLTSG